MSKYLTGQFFMLWLWPLLGAVVAALVSHASRNAALRRGLSREGYLHCGKCLYIVEGAGSFRCPECGTYQTVVGVRTITDFAPLALGYRIVIWMQFLVGPAYIGTLCILYMIPFSHTTDMQLWVHGGGLPLQITIDAEGYGFASSPTFTEARLRIEVDDIVLKEVHDSTITLRGLLSNDITPQSMFKQLDTTLTTEGISLADRTQVAADLAAVMDGLRTGDKPALGQLAAPSWITGVRSRFLWRPWWPMVIVFVWLVLLAAVVPRIGRGFKERQAAVDRHRIAVIERFRASVTRATGENPASKPTT